MLSHIRIGILGTRGHISYASSQMHFHNLSGISCCRLCTELLALAQLLGLHVHQMDVDTAFLYAKLKEEIYMHPPEGMDGIPEGKVLKLLKSL
jgi:hypothetical protein